MKFSLISAFILLAVCCSAVRGQSLNKEELKNLLTEVAADERRVAECEKVMTEAQIKEFGKPLPKIAGHCWSGCPTSIPKPWYPEAARRNHLQGRVTIAAVVDESGKVAYAKMIRGSGVFRRAALAAAYVSTYQPKVTCGNQPIKFWWAINYNFRPDM